MLQSPRSVCKIQKSGMRGRVITVGVVSYVMAVAFAACGGIAERTGGGAAAGASGAGAAGNSSGAGAASDGDGSSNTAGTSGRAPEARCFLPLARGSCDFSMSRYWFDSERGRCQSFLFTGCAGNENNFASLAECEAACMR